MAIIRSTPVKNSTPAFNTQRPLPGSFGRTSAVRGYETFPYVQQPKATINPVLGASTNSLPKLPVSGGGGGGAPVGGGAPTGDPLAGVLEQAPAAPGIDFDSLIAPAIQGLESAIGPLQQGYESQVGDIDRAKATNVARVQSETGAQQKTLEGNKVQQEQLGENAANEARRQFSEIQQGIQSRYGGTTGTGAFASELAGRQTMQNIGQVRQQVSNSLLELDNKIQQVKEIGQIAIQDAEDQALQQKNQAKSQLESALADIRRQKGELQSRKAELAMQAMQIYQGTVNEVNARNAAFKQDLFVRQQEAENQLKMALQRGSQVAQSYSLKDLNSFAMQNPNLFSPGSNFNFQGKLDTGGSFSLGAPEAGTMTEEQRTIEELKKLGIVG